MVSVPHSSCSRALTHIGHVVLTCFCWSVCQSVYLYVCGSVFLFAFFRSFVRFQYLFMFSRCLLFCFLLFQVLCFQLLHLLCFVPFLLRSFSKNVFVISFVFVCCRFCFPFPFVHFHFICHMPSWCFLFVPFVILGQDRIRIRFLCLHFSTR